MAITSPLLQLRLNRLAFIFCSLLMPCLFRRNATPRNTANAFATQHASITSGRSSMVAFQVGSQVGARHHTHRQETPTHLYGIRMNSGDQISTHSSVRKMRPRKANNSIMKLTSMIAPLLLAIKPASAASASGILSRATDLLNNAGTNPTSSYHLTKILFIRLLAIVYTAAFSVAKFQNKGLIGDRGISPAKNVLNAAQKRGETKSERRKEWLEYRKEYKSTAADNIFVKTFKDKLSNSTVATIFNEKFWHRTDRMDRPLPTLLWFAKDRDNLNPWLNGLANVGLFLSTLMLATGSSNVFLMLGLWLIQRSFMSVGGPFYGYGWEPQLAELTFHALFLVPLLSLNPFFGSTIGAAGAGAGNGVMGAFPVPLLVIWAIRWYLFKIMMGAGLIKMKSSDRKWKVGDMSAMDYFYETQPVPNPLTQYFHFMPKAWHRFEVWSNHFVELVAPFLLLMPFRNLRLIGGLIQIQFQLILITSGNLSFLNWLTIVPAIFCLDDAFLANNLPPLAQKIALGTPATQSYIQSITSGAISLRQAPMIRTISSIAFFLFVAKLNLNVVRNLLAKNQTMNGSFDKLRLVCTYGAFGVVSEKREELIIESANNINGPWKEYHFKVKPGDVHLRPRWISPYHHRIDWQMWIAAASGRVERSPWIYNFLLKILRQEQDVINLIETDPWNLMSSPSSGEEASNEGANGESHAIPKYIRIEKYRYKFHDKKNATSTNGQDDKAPYWERERVGRYFPKQGIMTADMLEGIIKKH